MAACKECPYKKKSLPGWLGDAKNPQDFLQQMDLVFGHPCHMSINWDKEEVDVLNAPLCEGMLQFAKNICKMLKYPAYEQERRRLKVNDSEIFGTKQEFIKHHNNNQ